MLKKMQKGFILAAMAAFGFVMILLVVGINFTNYMLMAASQDNVLKGIYEYDRKFTQKPDEKIPPISEMDWAGDPGAEFTKRFFLVWCDKQGNATLFDRKYIESIDEQTAEEYAGNIIKQGKIRGYYKDYRYLAEKTESGYEIIFLNVSDAMEFRSSLLIASLGNSSLCKEHRAPEAVYYRCRT